MQFSGNVQSKNSIFFSQCEVLYYCVLCSVVLLCSVQCSATLKCAVYWYCAVQWRAQIFEYLNIRIKWLSNIIRIRIRAISPVRIYSDIHTQIFGQPNIFEFLFVNSWKSQYFWIFAQNIILIFAYLILMKKVYLDIGHA